MLRISRIHSDSCKPSYPLIWTSHHLLLFLVKSIRGFSTLVASISCTELKSGGVVSFVRYITPIIIDKNPKRHKMGATMIRLALKMPGSKASALELSPLIKTNPMTTRAVLMPKRIKLTGPKAKFLFIILNSS